MAAEAEAEAEAAGLTARGAWSELQTAQSAGEEEVEEGRSPRGRNSCRYELVVTMPRIVEAQIQ